MNTQDKQRFFAAYWDQRVIRYQNNLHTPLELISHYWFGLDKSFAELTSLDQITDEHAKAAWKLFKCKPDECGYDTSWRKFKADLIKSGEIAVPLFDFYGYGHNVIDKLRSLGYLVSFDKYSCENLLELKWCKIKE